MTRETTKRAIATGSIILVILIIIGYSYITSHSLITGPSITVTTINGASSSLPVSGVIYASVGTSTAIINGIAQRVQSISFNGNPIVIDEAGNFSQIVTLFPGFNAETLIGQDAFGHTTKVELDLNRK
jgi:hypothetical protein